MSAKRKISKTLLVTLLALGMLLVSVTGVYAWNWLGHKDTGLDKAVNDNGFMFGVRYSQIGPVANKGHSLAGNRILTDLAEPGFDEAALQADFYDIRAFGMDAVSVPVFTWMEGILFDADGQITGLDENFTANLKKVMDEAKKQGLRVAVTLQPSLHELAVGTAGSGKAVWDLYTQMYYSETVRQQYIDLCVKPVLTVLKEYEDTLLQLTIISNPERDVYEVQGNFGTTWDRIVEFTGAVNDVCRAELPEVATTVETLPAHAHRFNGLALDAVGVDMASDGGEAVAPADCHSSFPLYVSRYSTEKKGATEDYITQKNRQTLTSAAEQGYIGAFFDEWRGVGDGNSVYVPSSDGQYRQWATVMYFNAFGYRQDRAETDEDNLPVLLYNRKDGAVKWIGSRNASAYTVERSVDDGKTWAAASGELSINDVDNGYFLCTWRDDDPEAAAKSRYRVIADKGTDTELISLPSN